MNQSKFLAITCNSLKPREKSRVHSAIGFGFASHWLKNWRESFKPITRRSNRNHVITFDSHLKTALLLRPIATAANYVCYQVFTCWTREVIISLRDTRASFQRGCCLNRSTLIRFTTCEENKQRFGHNQ